MRENLHQYRQGHPKKRELDEERDVGQFGTSDHQLIQNQRDNDCSVATHGKSDRTAKYQLPPSSKKEIGYSCPTVKSEVIEDQE
jgi:hypothetical protein